MDQLLVEAIEDSPLSSSDRYNLLLVADGKRPSAWMNLGSQKWREGDQPKVIDEALLDQVQTTIQQAGLVCAIERKISDTGLTQDPARRKRYRELAYIFVARDKKTLEDLMAARDSKDDRIFGLLLGYPATAVDGFMTGRRMPVSKLPLAVQLSEAAQFVEIILSENHWQEELAYIEKLSQRVLELSDIIHFDYRYRSGRIDSQFAEKLRDAISKK